MALTGQETIYYLARKNTTTNEDSVLRLNTYSGLFSQSDDFESASKYKTFEDAYAIVELHNRLAQLTGQAYEYYVIEYNVNSFRLDEEGNKVQEDLIEEEAPVEEETPVEEDAPVEEGPTE